MSAHVPPFETRSYQVELTKLWSGQDSCEPVTYIEFALGPSELRVRVDAPWWEDPAPPAPPGSTPELWNHEVVELFLLGSHQRYLEVELGPHGHYLVLQLEGARNRVRQGIPIEYEASTYRAEPSSPEADSTTPTRGATRWHGLARLPSDLLPTGISRFNAYAIHGTGTARVHLAYSPCPGTQPDFHQLECFAPLSSSEVHHGSCHCGQVAFRVKAPLSRAIVCNCSICTKKGFVHWIVDPSQFELLRGADQLASYRFNTNTAKHAFCRTCGIHPFYVPRSDPDKVDVNVRCLEGVRLSELQLDSFDGADWEEAIHTAQWRQSQPKARNEVVAGDVITTTSSLSEPRNHQKE